MNSVGEVKYDVFLSFRGEDTRYNFTDHLYHALCAAPIDTFRDDCKIETGDELKPELEDAIRGSKASIIVISENYATSTWCLNELALILEEKKKHSDRIVIPIFYHVDPSDVRKLENSFREAMDIHQSKIEAERDPPKKRQRIEHVERWKAALEEVAGLKGETVDHRVSEWEFIQKIVREINEKLSREASITNLPLLIGRNDILRNINSWLQNRSSNAADIFTICGIAGIGKTTLAKYIYHSNVGLPFDGRSFLQDIGSSAMLKLQKKLLRDIGMGSHEISDVDTGTHMIQKSLKKAKKLLLVLDDVNDVEQLKSLLGNEGFHRGTKVIITTNKMSLPQEIKKLLDPDNIQSNYNCEVCQLEGLSDDASLELLREHAFKSNCPNKGFQELSKTVAAYCGGHPLALKVLGESLYQRPVPVWEDTLKRLKKEFNRKIWKSLKVSFDLFEYESDKEVFKDVACILVGEERNCVETILEASLGIQNLIDYCLLTVDTPSNCLKMAQLIRELGRYMVRQGLQTNPSDECKLWCHEECLNVLKQKKMIKVAGDIKCFILDMKKLNLENSTEVNLKIDVIKEMRSLELLKLNFVTPDGWYGEFPPRLKWLCWHKFPLKAIPPELPMTALVALDMSHSKLQLWEPPQELPVLKILDLSWSKELSRTARFSKLPKLERLKLRGCTSLVEVDESIGDLGNVVFVDMSGCESLSNLPSLPSTIEELNVRQCKLLKKVTFKSDTPPELKLVDKSQCDQLTEIQGFFVVDYVKEVEEEVVNSLGWHFRAEQNLATKEYSHRGW